MTGIPYYGYDPYDYGFGGGMDDFSNVLLFVYAAYYLLAVGISILSYVLYSLGTYTIAQRRGIHRPWLAWIPYGNVWILGSIADQYRYVSLGQVKNRRKLLLGLEIALTALTMVLMIAAVSLVVRIVMMGSGDIEYILEELLLTSGGLLILIYLAIMALAILVAVFQYICLHDLFASCDPNNKLIYLVLSIFVSVSMPVLVFICRKKDLGMPPRKTDAVPTAPINPYGG